MDSPVVELRDVSKFYPRGRQLAGARILVRALMPLSLSVGRGDIVAVVGESGCGKSTLARVMAFIHPPTSGSVLVEGRVVGYTRRAEDVAARRQVQLVHQDPYAALNPRKTVQSILTTPLSAHGFARGRAAVDRAAHLLESVGLAPAGQYLPKYPYELSGGQRQRVVIARALTVEPRVLVADEAVSMIDVSLRQSILATLKTLRDQSGMAVVFITHDLAQARYFAAGHRTLVLYAGHVVEYGPTEAVIGAPRHPYTALLRTAVLDPDPARRTTFARVEDEGAIPDLTRTIPGCVYAARCPLVHDRCRVEAPALVGDSHQVACHLAADDMLGRVREAVSR